ncbi:hypothetical protein L0156_20235 [bacterium]|nr:hypothetical protein [bacterium]
MNLRSLKSNGFLVSFLLLLLSCVRNSVPDLAIKNPRVRQRIPILINLAEPWDDAEREYSGAAVYDDSVLLMPQYPHRVGNRIPMFPIKPFLVSSPDEVEQTPRAVPFDDDGLANSIEGFEGFEAFAFLGNNVFVTIESNQSGRMMGYLVRGRMILSELSPSIKLDATTLIELPPRANLADMADESIVILPTGRLLTFFEANGANVVRNPSAYLFDITGDTIKRLPDVPIPSIEYRLTDCSPADRSGHFWCINWMYPGDEAKLNPARDAFAERWGIDSSQSDAWRAGNKLVERLVELQFDGATVQATENSPIYLKLRSDGLPRNWESLAFVPEQGFFLATDNYPKTLFAFVRL